MIVDELRQRRHSRNSYWIVNIADMERNDGSTIGKAEKFERHQGEIREKSSKDEATVTAATSSCLSCRNINNDTDVLYI